METGPPRRFPIATEGDQDGCESGSASGLDDEVSSVLNGDSGDARSWMSRMSKAFVSPTKQNLSVALSSLLDITDVARASFVTYREAVISGLLPVESDDLYSQYTVPERIPRIPSQHRRGVSRLTFRMGNATRNTGKGAWCTRS